MKENTVCEINGQQSLAFVVRRSTPNITARNFLIVTSLLIIHFCQQKLLSVTNQTASMRIDFSYNHFSHFKKYDDKLCQ